MSEDLLARKPRLIRNCRLSESPQQPATLLMPEGILRLKGTGVDVVSLCDGSRTLREILDTLCSRFPSVDPLQIESEAMDFIHALRKKRVLDLE